jgi:hypothetical protein
VCQKSRPESATNDESALVHVLDLLCPVPGSDLGDDTENGTCGVLRVLLQHLKHCGHRDTLLAFTPRIVIWRRRDARIRHTRSSKINAARGSARRRVHEGSMCFETVRKSARWVCRGATRAQQVQTVPTCAHCKRRVEKTGFLGQRGLGTRGHVDQIGAPTAKHVRLCAC